MLYLQVIICIQDKKNLILHSGQNFDLIIEQLQRHKRATFLKICKYNISFN